MAVTTSNSGVLHFNSGDTTTDNLQVSVLLITNTTAAVLDVTINEGDNSTGIFVLSVPADNCKVIPFGGKGKNFSKGLAYTQANVFMSVFLA